MQKLYNRLIEADAFDRVICEVGRHDTLAPPRTPILLVR